MQSFVTRLLTINSPDSDIRRRGANIIILAIGILALCVVALPLLILQATSAVVYVMIGSAMLIYAGVIVLARRGYVTLGALIFIAAITLVVLGSSFGDQKLSIQTFFLALPVLIAGLSIRAWQVWLVLALNIAAIFVTLLLLPASLPRAANELQLVYGGIMLISLVAVMSYIGARSTVTALRSAQAARADAEAAAAAVNQMNANLEATVAERTSALQSALADVQVRADEQARLLHEIDQQRTTILELSVPVIPISTTTLVMPLVGALDTLRLRQVQEQALLSIEGSAVRYLLLDITGVPVVDSQVAQGLLAVVQAARLLGAEVFLVGIRPEVAQAIVGLGLNLQAMRTASSLQSALSQLDRRARLS